MEEASIAKYERVCQKLDLGPKDHLLEIGSGWGGFAMHAASHYGCRVTSVTISREQLALARQRVTAAGLDDQVEIRFQDYRDIPERFDKLVSIEMIEAVGHRYLEDFFRVCSEKLTPEGSMLLQAIVVQERDYENSRRTVDFVKRYIFPGGQLVSVRAMSDAMGAATDLRFTHLEDITPFYAETLRRWRQRMTENLEAIRALGLPQHFLSMWEYYLCYCEGAFEEREIGAVQVVLDKPRSRRQPILAKLTA
jgi:cyclopropane-fatty-acyl-phospholipid synthase